MYVYIYRERMFKNILEWISTRDFQGTILGCAGFHPFEANVVQGILFALARQQNPAESLGRHGPGLFWWFKIHIYILYIHTILIYILIYLYIYI